MKKDKAIDQYIKQSKEFAQPILKHFRSLVHTHCPETEETLKWGFPHFQYKGIMCSMASFSGHCAIGFWKGSLIPELQKIEDSSAMGQLGRISDLKDLPSDKVLATIIKKAMKLNDEGVKSPTHSKPKSIVDVKIPDYILTAIKKNKKVAANFTAFSNSQQKEYVEWIEEAKTETTRIKRLETMLEWVSEGKIRNWKYVKQK
ncbi:MAG: YdeI/OmpD-associated family protein [Bacteroidetes bacterium]|nr:YdeI/OmpD-associated family protein [Bacteroidota bacterium]MBK9412884.1 YdeI/OmpD-associated family protein [Bacteroidota bacterium]MBL0032382.1 YdeI/OmpD-associated family protein [Bacteroidota bacterium]MBP6426006.1 YdeI/OmpD-associated family protein [Bacteroidia bacterium]MBP6657468.1 YdeI/OmpD-associated family protein [Bacteroidia bacterium]